jgi:nicotinamide mononucleotide (NMN) deamidase PncC
MILTRIDEVREALKVLLTKDIRLGILGASAGSGLMANLATIPGLTKMFHEAHFPHSKEATSDYLGFVPENFVCMDTALEQAMRAYYRAYQPDGKRTIGVGATGSVATNEVHRGEHRVWVGVVTDDLICVYYARFTKGFGEEVRARDLLACDMLIGEALLEAVGAKIRINLPSNVEFTDYISDCSLQASILLRKRPYFRVDGQRLTWESMTKEVADFGAGVYPGSFRFPHFGHFGVADAFTQKYHQPVVFAIEVNPPHKGDLTAQDMLKRAKMLKGRNVVFTWDAPYYLDKARIFPNTKIILGADAFVSLMDSKWGISVEELRRVFHDTGTKLVVADRMVDGVFTMVNNPLAGFSCERLPVRFDVSSSELLRSGV